MNTTKGTKPLASGNLFSWEHTQMTGRGAIQGRFSSQPSDADVAEANCIMASLAPPHATTVLQELDTERASNARRDQFLMGVSRN